MPRHIHIHMRDYGPGQNPASHQAKRAHETMTSRGWTGGVGGPYTHPKHGTVEIKTGGQQYHGKTGEKRVMNTLEWKHSMGGSSSSGSGVSALGKRMAAVHGDSSRR